MTAALQPNLGAEGVYSDLEKYFVSHQPKNLWPENQNSNLGLLRLLLISPLENVLTLLDELSNETFITTANGYLGLWEDDLGLPKGQGGRTITARRAALLARREIGPFTRSRRAKIVERFIQETFGPGALAFTAEGISIGSGVDLFGDPGDVSTSYKIVENITGFSYIVYILNTITPDTASLTRELKHITPAHINFTIDNTVSVLP